LTTVTTSCAICFARGSCSTLRNISTETTSESTISTTISKNERDSSDLGWLINGASKYSEFAQMRGVKKICEHPLRGLPAYHTSPRSI
jgi:hypothetical protein